MGERPIKWTLAISAGGAPLTVDYADLELFDTSLPFNVEEFEIAPGTFVRDQTQMMAGVTTSDADTVTSYQWSWSARDDLAYAAFDLRTL